MLRAIDLSKRYRDGSFALDALNLEVSEGEVCCLLGARGSGKSTAIRLLLGLVRPSGGRAEVAGFDVAEDTRRARRNAAYLPADFPFYDRLTARENLRFFTLLGGRGEVAKAQESLAMREVGLAERLFDERVSKLRLGERQKLAVAIALAGNVPVWLLDEPISGLDPRAAAEIVELIAMARDRGKAVLWATQDLFRARELADRIGILEEGRQVLSYSREELGFQDVERLYLEYMLGGGGPGGLR
ncbi:MAG: ABC transporter ATP-binding protein [Holophagales bacterium]|nr:ABC transporter ATP-binding protein [Holophagales bacterium]